MQLENPKVLDASFSVSKALNEITKTGLPVFVVKNGKYIGAIDERIVRRHLSSDPSKEKCETVAEPTPTLSSKSSIIDACHAIFTGRIKAIPVIEKNKIIGAITRYTLLQELLDKNLIPKKKVSEVMTSPVVTIEYNQTLGQLKSQLRKHNIRRAVVTKDGKIEGIISVFDLANFLIHPKNAELFYQSGEKTDFDSQPISAYMKKTVETISENESIVSAAKKMIQKRVFALVVEKDRFPIGIITAKDIIHSVLEKEKPARIYISGLSEQDKEFYPKIISEGEKLLQKFGDSHASDILVLHIKKEGSEYSIRAKLNGNKSYVAAASDYDLVSALHMVFDELRKLISKEKDQKIAARKRSKNEYE